MDKILYYSTNLKAPEVNFENALLSGLAPDKGLYLPKSMPLVNEDEIKSMKDMNYAQIAGLIAKKFLASEIDENALDEITQDAYNFDIPIEKVTGNDYLMRLDQGPTASFKDFGARMMARLVRHFLKKQNKEITIITATSGDTGSAVAHAFYGLDNIRVVVLFPTHEVSDRQRKQMTTLGKNVTTISIDCKFDDCQAMVKQAFSDPLLKELNITSANSINVGRLVPQTFYYFYAYSRIVGDEGNIVFSIPSGNFGNLMAGIFAKKIGLPVKKFVSAVNENDEFPRFVETGTYQKMAPSKNCISNAMNVGHPSNLARIVGFYGGQMDQTGAILKAPNMETIRKDIFTVSVTDEQTRETIKNTYKNHNTIIEPHGAVSWKGLELYREKTNDQTIGVSLETAHPAKFPDDVVKLTGVNPRLPESLKSLDGKEEHIETIALDYDQFRDFLTKKFL